MALLSGYARFYSLYVVWQSGVAVLLGAFLPLREDTAKAADQQFPWPGLRIVFLKDEGAGAHENRMRLM